MNNLITRTKQVAEGKWLWFLYLKHVKGNGDDLIASSLPCSYESQEDAEHMALVLLETIVREHYREICRDKGIHV